MKAVVADKPRGVSAVHLKTFGGEFFTNIDIRNAECRNIGRRLIDVQAGVYALPSLWGAA